MVAIAMTFERVYRKLDKTPAVIANIIKVANACAPSETKRIYADPMLNSMRFNLLKTLVGVQGRDALA